MLEDALACHTSLAVMRDSPLAIARFADLAFGWSAFFFANLACGGFAFLWVNVWVVLYERVCLMRMPSAHTLRFALARRSAFFTFNF